MATLSGVLDEIKNAVDNGKNGKWTFVYPHGKKNEFSIAYSDNSKKFTINNCIRIYYEKDGDGENYFVDTLYLGSYYYEDYDGFKCRDNPSIDHDDFFEFFTKLGEKLKVAQLSLVDASTKRFTGCKVPKLIFALAGRPTFYEKHGFENSKFTELVKDWRELTLDDFLEKTESKLTHLGTSLIRDVCKFVLKVCKEEDTRDETLTSQGVANVLIDAILKRAKFLFGEVEFDNIFTKPIKSGSGGRKRRTRRR